VVVPRGLLAGSDARDVPFTMVRDRRRRAAVIPLAVGAAVLGWFLVPIARVELDETSLPPGPDAASLPRDVRVVDQEELCGSGGCYRQATLRWPDHSRGQLLAVLGLEGGTSQETCTAVSLLDRRRVCTGADEVLLRQPAADDEVRIYVRWNRPLGL
jgi:hypothetical protein